MPKLSNKNKKQAIPKNVEMSDMWGENAGTAKTDEHPRATWFRESKYAMFIHWGLYSQAANVWNGKNWHGISEWLMTRSKIPVREYEKLAASFNPVDFDADEIAKLAKAAGMKYIVLTSKHHEGFAMFKSAASKFNSVDATPFKRDVAGELADACKKHGLGIGFYYSQFLDWHEKDGAGNNWDFPEQRDFDKFFQGKVLPQVTELLTNYGPVSLIWFDTPGTIPRESSQELYELVRRLQPECLVNSRIGNGMGDYSSAGDQEIPLVVPEGLWESVDTHNDTWAYSQHDHNWKTPSEVITRLVKVVSLGGNYMLNIGPTGKGLVPAESANILREAGRWIKKHEKAIYGTDKSPIPMQPWGAITSTPGKLYLHVFQWPSDGKIYLPGLKLSKPQATIMGSGKKLKLIREKGIITVEIPSLPPVRPFTVIELSYDGKIKTEGSVRILHPGLDNIFEAPFAETSNCEKAKRQWMEKFGDWHHAEVIEKITTGSKMSWNFTAFRNSLWRVHLEYECHQETDESEIEFSIGETSWRFPVFGTGGGISRRTRFRREMIGVVEVPSFGEYILKLKGTDVKGNNQLIIRRIVLESI